MATRRPLLAHSDTTSFDIYCPLATIAEHFHTCCSFLDPALSTIHTASYVDGKKVTYTIDRSLRISGKWYKTRYGWTIEDLSRIFCTEFNKDDYPVTGVRVHVQWKHPEIARYIYNLMVRKHPDITLESPDTIGVDCKTLDEVEELWLVFLEYENMWAEEVALERRIEQYNNDNRLESSTHGLITTICFIIIIIGLIRSCM